MLVAKLVGGLVNSVEPRETCISQHIYKNIMSFSSLLILLCLLLISIVIIKSIKRYRIIKCFGLFIIIIILFGVSFFISVFLKVDHTPIIEGHIIDFNNNQPIPDTIVRCRWRGKVLETTTILKELYIIANNNGYYKIPAEKIKTSFKKGELRSISLEYLHPYYRYKIIIINERSDKIKINELLKIKQYQLNVNIKKFSTEYNEIIKNNCNAISSIIYTKNSDYFYWAKKANLIFNKDDIWKNWEKILRKTCADADYKLKINNLERLRKVIEKNK